MNTKTTLLLSQVLGFVFLVCMNLRSWTGWGAFAAGGIICALLSIGFLCYGWFRESERGDRSQTLSPRFTLLAFGSVGLFISFVFYRTFVY